MQPPAFSAPAEEQVYEPPQQPPQMPPQQPPFIGQFPVPFQPQFGIRPNAGLFIPPQINPFMPLHVPPLPLINALSAPFLAPPQVPPPLAHHHQPWLQPQPPPLQPPPQPPPQQPPPQQLPPRQQIKPANTFPPSDNIPLREVSLSDVLQRTSRVALDCAMLCRTHQLHEVPFRPPLTLEHPLVKARRHPRFDLAIAEVPLSEITKSCASVAALLGQQAYTPAVRRRRRSSW